MLNAFEITQDTEEGKLWSILGACDFDYLAVYSKSLIIGARVSRNLKNS